MKGWKEEKKAIKLVKVLGEEEAITNKHVRMTRIGYSVSRKRSMPPITFIDEDFQTFHPYQDDPMVIIV